MRITVKRLEKLGFDVEKDDRGYNLQQYTPAGEDWNLYFHKLEDIKDYAEKYDPEDDFNMWIEAKQSGFAGVPGIDELWQDQLWKQNLLNQLI